MRTTARSTAGSFRKPARAAFGLALVGVVLAGCGNRERAYEVTDVRERADGGVPSEDLPPDVRFGARRAPQADAPPATGAAMWAYTTPAGWEDAPPAPMRDLLWRVPGKPDVDCSFSALPGRAGSLLDNVNRWRKQMSIAPIDEAAVAALPKKTLIGRPATYVELAGVFQGMGGQTVVSGAKLLGLIVELPMATLFLKMTGPAAAVDAESGNFLALAESLKMKTGGPSPHAPTAPPPGAADSAPYRWTAPAGWKELGEKPMRVVTFVPDGAKGTEAYVTVLSGSAGGARSNVDRWRSQMGAAPMTDDEFAKSPRKTILGGEAVFVAIEGSYAGMEAAQGKAGWLLLGMIVPRGDTTVFVKMTGPAGEVNAERERFQSFCESFHD